MSRIAVFNQKGGVGKTTTVLNLSAALSQHALQPVMIDMDPQGHLTHIYNKSDITAAQTLHSFYLQKSTINQLVQKWPRVGGIIPAHKELIKLDSMFGKGSMILNRLKYGIERYEKIAPKIHYVMDCCPYLGVLSLNAIFAADLVIVPIASDYLSYQGALNVDKTLHSLEAVLKRRVERRYLLTRYDKRKVMALDIQKRARRFFGQDLCNTVINENVAIAASPQHFQDIFSYSPTSSGARDYQALYFELVSAGLIGKKIAQR